MAAGIPGIVDVIDIVSCLVDSSERDYLRVSLLFFFYRVRHLSMSNFNYIKIFECLKQSKV